MLVFDTDVVPPRERADAVSSAMLEATLSTQLVHLDPDDVWLRMEGFRLGAVELARVATSGMDTRRTPRQTAGDAGPVVALTLGVGAGLIDQAGVALGTAAHTVSLVELTRPYRSRIPHGTDGWSFKIPIEELAVTSDVVRRARRGLTASPVHAVFAQHFRAVARQAASIEANGSGAMVGTATIALARALICSATDAPDLQDALAESLLLRIQTFVRQHLRDTRLTPEAIASAHHISVRQLYRVFADAGLSLEQWVLRLRLDGARDDLARIDRRGLTVAAVARRWGFVNPSHFSQRFRKAYGVTPREWRELGTHGTRPGTQGTPGASLN